MKLKKFLSLFVVVLLCLSSLSAFAADDSYKEVVAVPKAEVTESIDYSDMSNWAYWNNGEGKPADLFFVCPTVDMGKGGK